MGRKNSYKRDNSRIVANTINVMFLIVLVALLLSSCCSMKEKREIFKDTVLVDVYRDTLSLIDEPEITYDSTQPDIVIKPLEWEIDTIIPRYRNNTLKYDTLKAKYSYPGNLFEFEYLPPTDSIFVETITETITQVEELGFWDYIPIVVSTALIFFVLGYIVSKFR